MCFAIKLSAIVLLATTSSAQCTGVVQGTVLDDRGRPLAQASVTLLEKGQGAGHRVIRSFTSDTNGHFSAEVSKEGTYLLVGQKEDQGYPDTKLAFYSNLHAPEVLVDCINPNVGIILRLGPKAGYLHRISVRNAKTDQPVAGAVITLRRASSAQLFISTSTTYPDIAVPSDTKVSYQVSAPGFETSVPSVIQLYPSESRSIQVELTPSSASAPQPLKAK